MAVLGILSCHGVLLAYSGLIHSPTIYELGHVPAGLSHWQYGLFDLYRVNPPLPRLVATAPLLLLSPKTDWTDYSTNPLARDEIPMGIRFARANGNRTFWLFTISRWAIIPFSLLGGMICFQWAKDLHSAAGGLIALTLWCASPSILGDGALVMPDVPAAALGILAAYRFWIWLQKVTWTNAFLAGVTLGLALLCKTTCN